ncbi:MAG: energy transducer TonB [Sphingomonadales bacterium]|nr:energy transducer TonB [Sphingomonadales bacterium]
MSLYPRNLLLRIAVVAAAVAAAPAHADDEVLEGYSPWTIDHGELECRLKRVFGEGDDFVQLAIMRASTSQRVTFELLSDRISRRRPSVRATIILLPQEIEFTRPTSIETLQDRDARLMNLYGITLEDLAQFRENQIIAVRPRHGREFRLRLDGFEQALRELDQCNDELLAGWGVDVAYLHTLSVWPQPRNDAVAWVTYNDYPREARRNHMVGTTYFSLAVDAEGNVEDCTIVVSSGSELLDGTTCRLLSERARFMPARDAEGNPVAAPWVSQVRYSIPD